jgi:hypothetical protein
MVLIKTIDDTYEFSTLVNIRASVRVRPSLRRACKCVLFRPT